MGVDADHEWSANPFRRSIMADRTTQTVVCFSSSFELPNLDAPQPAGLPRRP
jgi:hypothetical protein